MTWVNQWQLEIISIKAITGKSVLYLLLTFSKKTLEEIGHLLIKKFLQSKLGICIISHFTNRRSLKDTKNTQYLLRVSIK